MNPEWLAAGQAHLWMPYCQMKTADAPLPVVRTEGSRLHLADGRTLIDGIASWWTACHGYNHPRIIEAIQAQAALMPHVMLGGLVHEGAAKLATRLSAMVPGRLPRVFFSESGSVAVEVALKMALQYWRNLGHANKHKFVCFRHGYHGDTLGAMGVSDPEQGLHQAFRHYAFRQPVVDIPTDEYGFAELEALLRDLGPQIAGVIVEPLVQGAGGMKFHSPDVLAELYRLTKAQGLLFIADEIATGFGRTGSLFACDEAGITPDILCLGKALTGGALPLAATLASEEVFSAFWSDDPAAAFMHGPTYMANPLAVAAANASLDIFAHEPRLDQVAAIELQMQHELAACRALPGVVDVRVKGALGVVQLQPEAMDRAALRRAFVETGCFIRPLEDVVYLSPAFTISSAELTQLTQAVWNVLQART